MIKRWRVQSSFVGKPGATIKKEIDLVERDLAWKKDVKKEEAFLETVEEIKAFLQCAAIDHRLLPFTDSSLSYTEFY